jgi:hypothetical protein
MRLPAAASVLCMEAGLLSNRAAAQADMSVVGPLQTCPAKDGMSASPLKAEIGACGQHVRYGARSGSTHLPCSTSAVVPKANGSQIADAATTPDN